MTSKALIVWQTRRAERLEKLLAAHRAMSGDGPGRRWLAELNHALVVRLASEFQGFCRDLHDESIDAFLDSNFTADVRSVVRALLENGRKLDSGNANWGNIGNDFARIGVSVADELRAANASRYATWIARLEALNKARNAIAHDDHVALRTCEAAHPLTLRTFRTWRTSVDRVASGLDQVVGRYLGQMSGSAPW